MGPFLRIVIILLGLWLVLLLIKRALARRRKTDTDQPAIAKMVACAYCGTHVPESDAVQDGTQHYCCREHREKSRN